MAEWTEVTDFKSDFYRQAEVGFKHISGLQLACKNGGKMALGFPGVGHMYMHCPRKITFMPVGRNSHIYTCLMFLASDEDKNKDNAGIGTILENFDLTCIQKLEDWVVKHRPEYERFSETPEERIRKEAERIEEEKNLKRKRLESAVKSAETSSKYPKHLYEAMVYKRK